MAITYEAFGFTDVGRVREHNEDSYHVDMERGLFVVADGMGGHAAGEVASAEAIDQIVGMIRRRYDEVIANARTEDDYGAVCRVIESAIQAATYMVFGMAEQDPAQRGMGTTISTMLIAHDMAFLGQVGDSRIYRCRNNVCEQLTEDHTLVNLHLKSGVITAEQAKKVKYGNMITRAVGVKDYVEVDTFQVPIERGDTFLLCSDGLSEYFPDASQLRPFLAEMEREPSVRALINVANERGGKDNITSIRIDCA
jgi:protein phosphatase